MNVKDTYLGFTDNKKGVQKSRIESILDKLTRVDGNIMTEKEFIYTYLQKGYKPHIEHDYTYWSAKINDYVKPRTVYWFQTSTSNCFEINKTLYDFANYIIENDLLNEQKAKNIIQLEKQKQEESARIKEQEEQEKRLRAEKEREEWKKKRQEKLAAWEELGNKLLTDDVKNIITETIDNHWSKIEEVYPQTNKEQLIENYLNNLPQRLGNSEHMKSRIQYLIYDDINKNNLNNIIEKDIFMQIFKIEETDSKHTITAKVKALIEGREYKGSKPKETFYILTNGKFIEAQGDKIILDEFTLYGRIEKGQYILTEESAGVVFAKGTTKGEAVENARKNIERHGKERIKQIIEKTIEQYGASPILQTA